MNAVYFTLQRDSFISEELLRDEQPLLACFLMLFVCLEAAGSTVWILLKRYPLGISVCKVVRSPGSSGVLSGFAE